jgi:hypothetical protein
MTGAADFGSLPGAADGSEAQSAKPIAAVANVERNDLRDIRNSFTLLNSFGQRAGTQIVCVRCAIEERCGCIEL